MSDKQQHTPGPWMVHTGSTGAGVKGPSGESVAWCGYVWQSTKGEVPFQANANLIAAAPQLLAIVKRLQAAFGEFCCENCITESDLEDGGDEILHASRAADELLRELEGK